MCMGEPVYSWDLDVAERTQNVGFDGNEYHEFMWE